MLNHLVDINLSKTLLQTQSGGDIRLVGFSLARR